MNLFCYNDIVKLMPVILLKRSANLSTSMPGMALLAAERLFELGEKDFAVTFLIKQLELYKSPDLSRNLKHEICCEAAVLLGEFKDNRALEPLFTALGRLTDSSAAYALSKFKRELVEVKLLSLAGVTTPEEINAAIALGFMKNDEIVSVLIDIYENRKSIRANPNLCLSIGYFDTTINLIFGSYSTNKLAEDTFRKNISKPVIESCLSGYVLFDRTRCAGNPSANLGWQITTKHGWDSYLTNSIKRNAFTYPSPGKEVEKLREAVVGEIWADPFNSPLKNSPYSDKPIES